MVERGHRGARPEKYHAPSAGVGPAWLIQRLPRLRWKNSGTGPLWGGTSKEIYVHRASEL